MYAWIAGHAALMTTLLVLSVVTFAATLIAVPWYVIRIPRDYFAKRRRGRMVFEHPRRHVFARIGKNALGVVFVLAGVAMILLPGQGVLTILLGIMLTEFPGKYRFERWLVRRRAVLGAINWLRERAGRPPLIVDLG